MGSSATFIGYVTRMSGGQEPTFASTARLSSLSASRKLEPMARRLTRPLRGAWQLLLPAAALLGCYAADRPAVLDYDAAESLRAEARELESAGRCEDALERYLECFTTCPAAARQVGPALRRLSRQCPSAEPRVWQAVELAETEVASDPISEAELTGRVFALLSVYQSWDRPERAEALQARLRKSLSLRSYHEALTVLAAAGPTGLHSLDENDAALLLSDVLEAPLYDGVMIRLGELGVESSNDSNEGG